MFLNFCLLIYASWRVDRKWILSIWLLTGCKLLPLVMQVLKGASYVASLLPISPNISRPPSMSWAMPWPQGPSACSSLCHTQVFHRWGKMPRWRPTHVWSEFYYHSAFACRPYLYRSHFHVLPFRLFKSLLPWWLLWDKMSIWYALSCLITHSWLWLGGTDLIYLGTCFNLRLIQCSDCQRWTHNAWCYHGQGMSSALWGCSVIGVCDQFMGCLL